MPPAYLFLTNRHFHCEGFARALGVLDNDIFYTLSLTIAIIYGYNVAMLDYSLMSSLLFRYAVHTKYPFQLGLLILIVIFDESTVVS